MGLIEARIKTYNKRYRECISESNALANEGFFVTASKYLEHSTNYLLLEIVWIQEKIKQDHGRD